MIGHFRDLRGFVPNLRAAFAKLAVTSSFASFAEAGALVVVVRVALGLTDDSLAPLQLPFTDTSVSNAALVAVAGVLALVNLLLHIVESHLKASLISDVYRGARRASIRAFISASWSRQSLEREGALQETVTSLTTQSANLMLTLVTLLTSTLHLAVLLVIAAVVNPLATLGVIAFGAVLFAALRPIAHSTERRATQWVRRNTAFAEQMTSTSALAMELRLFGRDAEARSRLESLNDEVADTMRRMRVVSGIGGTMYRDIALLVIVGAIASVLNADQQSLVGFGVVALLVLRSVGSAQRVQSSLQSARETAPALASLHERIASLEASAEATGTSELARIDHVTFESVGYSYGSGPPALTDVDLTIVRGEVLGVVGPSGSGKSTLAQLLLRLRRPTSGRISIDGRDYVEYAADDWSRLVALVPQDARLLEGTIADNVRFLRDGYSDEAVMAAVVDAHLAEDLDRFPDGLQTRLGPRGGGLSGGQRQRIAIARALLGRPELLVLDEPTSALDVTSEQLLKVTIADLKAASTTMVIIAHRLTTLESCDRIAVVKDGKLDQIGTRDELTRSSGFYRSVVAALAQP